MRPDHKADLTRNFRYGHPYLYGTSPWRPLDHPGARHIPAAVRPWIELDTSMTARLREHIGADVTVRVLANGNGKVHPDEQRFFTPRRSKACIREVVLDAPEHPLLVARTVFSPGCLRAVPALSTLGSRPLGELLFARGTARWQSREYGRITRRAVLSSLVRKGTGHDIVSCWARRTLFLLDRHSLLVTEIFLPSLLFVSGDQAGVSPADASPGSAGCTATPGPGLRNAACCDPWLAPHAIALPSAEG